MEKYQKNKRAIHTISALDKDSKNIKVRNQVTFSSSVTEEGPLFVGFSWLIFPLMACLLWIECPFVKPFPAVTACLHTVYYSSLITHGSNNTEILVSLSYYSDKISWLNRLF